MEQSCESKPGITDVADFQTGGGAVPLEEIGKGVLPPSSSGTSTLLAAQS